MFNFYQNLQQKLFISSRALAAGLALLLLFIPFKTLALADPAVLVAATQHSSYGVPFKPLFNIQLYTVKKGDNLKDLAIKYELSRQGIVLLNSTYRPLTINDQLEPGTTLLLPEKPLNPEIGASFAANGDYKPIQNWLKRIGNSFKDKGNIPQKN